MDRDSDVAVLLALQQTAAVADILAIICTELSSAVPQQATKIASLLESLSDNPDVEVTQSFAQMAPWFAQHLRGNIDQPFLSLQKRPPSESGLETLQTLLQKMKEA